MDFPWTSASSTELVNSEEDEEEDEESSGMPDDCDDTAQEIVVTAGDILEGAIVTETESDGNYPNNVCQEWNIITVDNEVLSFKANNPCMLFLLSSDPTWYVLLYGLIDYFMFQCIVITDGDRGFNTESGYDFVVFKDSNSSSGKNLLSLPFINGEKYK